MEVTPPVKKSIFPFLVMSILALNTIADPAAPAPRRRSPRKSRRRSRSTATSASTSTAGCATRRAPRRIAYLEAENAYADAVMKPTEELQKKLYDEMLGPHQADRHPGAVSQGRATSITRARWRGSSTRSTRGRRGTSTRRRRSCSTSTSSPRGRSSCPSARWRCRTTRTCSPTRTDDNGYRQYKLFVKDLRTGKVTEIIAERVGSVEWAKDNKTLFYSVENDAKRSEPDLPPRPRRRPSTRCSYEEKDELYDVYVERSRERRLALPRPRTARPPTKCA